MAAAHGSAKQGLPLDHFPPPFPMLNSSTATARIGEQGGQRRQICVLWPQIRCSLLGSSCSAFGACHGYILHEYRLWSMKVAKHVLRAMSQMTYSSLASMSKRGWPRTCDSLCYLPCPRPNLVFGLNINRSKPICLATSYWWSVGLVCRRLQA